MVSLGQVNSIVLTMFKAVILYTPPPTDEHRSIDNQLITIIFIYRIPSTSFSCVPSNAHCNKSLISIHCDHTLTDGVDVVNSLILVIILDP